MAALSKATAGEPEAGVAAVSGAGPPLSVPHPTASKAIAQAAASAAIRMVMVAFILYPPCQATRA